MIDDTVDAAPSAQRLEDDRFHLQNQYRQHGVYVTEHRLEVPLDYRQPQGQTITIFAREISKSRNEGPCCDQPAMIFMQGGPGGRAPRPGDFRSGWIGEALKTHRVVLMDERGTGQSTRLDALTLSEFDDVEDAANYVRCFRADSMVEDAELLRHAMNASKPWACLGQSYGGFITTTYLSRHPDGLSEAYFTGGLPGLVDLEDIYLRTYQLTAARNRVYFERYPEDQDTLRTVLKHLANHQELLPSGERLTPERLRMLGMMLGTTTGFDQLHYFFEGPFTFVKGETRLNTQFLDMVWRQVSMGDSPMYGLLHETIYAGATPALAGRATNWTAARLLERVGQDVPVEFAPYEQLEGADTDVFLTGEHIYPWLFEQDPALMPLAELADKLATDNTWPTLYDEDVLAGNGVPAAGAVYAEDMFVPMDLSLQTAALARVRPWVTNEFQHDGLRVDGARVLAHLMELAKD